MANENDFLDFADGVGATVIDQATYVAAPWRPTGFQNGIALPEQLNKVWRQSAAMAAAMATFIVAEISQDVLDNGNIAALAAQIALAVQQAATIKPPPRIVTASTNIVLLGTDYLVGLNRTSALAPFSITLFNGMQPGQEVKIQDLVGNLFADNVTLLPPAGTINGKASYVMNEDLQTAIVTYYGSNIYGLES